MKALQRLWVVYGTRGEYSDRTEWTVCAFADKIDAEKFCKQLQQEVRDAGALYEAREPWALASWEAQRALVAELDAKHSDPFLTVEYGDARYASYWVGLVYAGRPPTREEWANELARMEAERTGRSEGR